MARKAKAEPIMITQNEVINYAIMTVAPRWMRDREMYKKVGMDPTTSMWYPRMKALLELYKLYTGEEYQLEADGWTMEV